MSDPSIDNLHRAILGDTLSRRQVLRRGAALGLTAPAIAALLAACGGSSSSTTPTSSSGGTTGGGTTATTSTGAAGGTPATSASPTTATTAGAGRGKGGQLKLLWWQAPTILNGHLSQGTKDFDASRVVLEPLADFDKDGNLVPILAAEIPSQSNGGVASDGKSVTWKLKPGVKWSDGQSFTSADVKFTYDYVSNKDTSETTAGYYTIISSIDTPDPQTVTLNFANPTPNWYSVFCGVYGMIVPQHALSDFTGSKARNAPFNLKPIGTGAYKVDSFKPGDNVQYSINDSYREPNKPFFARINMKGGGDATSAAHSVIQTGEVDYAWNLQVTGQVLNSLQQGGTGQVVVYPGTGVERILINETDPNKEVDGE